LLAKKLVGVVLQVAVSLVAAAITGVAVFSQSMATAQTFFSCTDDRGRQISADRPIAECADRNQNELGAAGTVRKVRGPTLTVIERNALDEKEKIAADANARVNEEKRLSRALLLRYPTRAVHDKERGLALTSLAEKNQALQKNISTLNEQREKLDKEFEFYAQDKSKAPIALKHQYESVESSLTLQKRYLSEQELEKTRINSRFDLELTKLTPQWSVVAPNISQQSEKK
jgi:hypothetical protein